MAGESEAYKNAMQLGHSAAWEQDWRTAAEYYTQALNAAPENARALGSLGLAYFELDEYEIALRYYLRAARAASADPLPFEKIAILCERLGRLENSQKAALQAAELHLKNRDLDKAIENWERVLRLNPNNQRALSRVAQIYEHLGKKEESAQLYLTLAAVYQAEGALENAVRVVNRALQIEPDNQQARQALVLLRDFKPLPRSARKPVAPPRLVTRKSVGSQPDSPQETVSRLNPIENAQQQALQLLASLMFDVAENESGEQELKRGLQSIVGDEVATEIRPDVDWSRIVLHLSQVIDLQNQGMIEQAAEEMERAIEAGLEHPAAYFELGYLRLQLHQLDSAFRSLQYAISHPDFALGVRLLLGKNLLENDRLQEATTEYLQALRMADAAVVPGDQGEELNQLYESIIEAQSLQKDRASQERICRNISELLMQPDWRSQLQRARQQLPARSNGGPPVPLAEILTQARSSEVVKSLTNIYQLAAQGSLRSAMEESFYAIQYAPTYLPLHAYIGELLLQQGQIQDAITKFLVVARTYNTRGEPGRSIEFYRRIIGLAPLDLNPRSRLIELLVGIDRLDDALQEYLDFAEVHYSLADLDSARKTYVEALQLAQMSGGDVAWRVRILHRLADIDLQSLDWRQALRAYEQIVKLDPGDERAHSSLIELNYRLGQEKQALIGLDQYIAFLVSGERGSEAIRFTKDLVEDNPDRASIRHRLAHLYQAAGQKTEAIQQYDTAGELLLQQGDRAKAVEMVDAILALQPENSADYQRLAEQLRMQ